MLGTSFPYQSASQTVMDDPVDLKIRISSDRRSKVAVILRCKSEMSAAFRSIFCLFHGTQGQAADLCLIGHSLNTFQNLLDLTRRDLLSGFLYVDSFIMKKHQKTFNLFRIRIFMSSVYKRIISGAVFLCNCFIGKKHKILNDPGCHIGLIRLHINSSSCSIQDDLTLRKIKINGTSCMPTTAQDPGKLFHQEKHRDQSFITFLRHIIGIFQNIFHICVTHTLIYTDHCFCDLMGNHLSFFINIHQTA